MTSTHDETILRMDGRDRVRTPIERREALLDEFERSGLSGMRFAKLAGIKYATFANWIQKRRRARKVSPGDPDQGGSGCEEVPRSAPVRLFEAFAQASAGSDGLQIELPGGARLRVDSPGQARLAAEVLRMISSPGVRPC
jgi:hypothetical protein